ncbi:MAG: 50S ribosomal protein L25 [Candidatus Komeilibacteria bacterium CG_4_10_14_0_2_um_filter_37_10]|uniref:Large ribosomal subunit protein bL25 n=1 Tax=Candidatus Komeilibacteria bacterium CG_4_10_14_0_2_um_filter_37_10 TaxID=1974470 RepID=A0A2M7VGX1_9BACT|nr:MAG: 50S ribosomal protein L25 [Candidatus Komeilibacteria bacterium CG_4_10_14_0_2_um_filter_37_10]
MVIQDVILNSQIRELGNRGVLKAGLRVGKIPAVIYGFQQANQNIWLDKKEAEKVYLQAGTSTVVALQLPDGKTTKIIFREVQRDPVKDSIIHIDLVAIDLTKPVEVTIPIHLVGESPAVKFMGAIMIQSLDHLDIKCLPEKLIHEIKVDISTLADLNDAIHIKDLALSEGVEYEVDPGQMIVSVRAPKVEAVAAVAAAPAEGEAVATPVTEEKKEDGKK